MNQIERGVKAAENILSEVQDEQTRQALVALFTISTAKPAAHAESLIHFYQERNAPDPYDSARSFLVKLADNIPLLSIYCRAVNAAHKAAGIKPISGERAYVSIGELLEQVDIDQLKYFIDSTGL